GDEMSSPLDGPPDRPVSVSALLDGLLRPGSGSTRQADPARARQRDVAGRLRKLEAVPGAIREITRELDPDRLLGLVTRHASSLVDGDGGLLYLWDEADRVLVPRSWSGLGSLLTDVRLGLGEGAAGLAARDRRGVI